MVDCVIKNGRIYLDGRFVDSDLRIDNGVVGAIGQQIDCPEGYRSIDANGMAVVPGLADLHVHLRQPGFESKETIATGSAAAAAGGFTTVCAMPNLDPVPDTPEHLAVESNIIARDAVVEVRPYAAITKGRLGEELVDYKALAGLVVGFSDDGSGVKDYSVMEQAMLGVKDAGSIVAAHCEVASMVGGGYIHQGDYAATHNHRGICSESEWREVEQNIELVRRTGCRLHICHVSTRESVELIRAAKRDGLPVSGETAPHYLAFTDADLRETGSFKMNPPIRSSSDRRALIEAIIDGTIDAIATDHAPHTAEQKSRGLAGSAMGIVGLETALPIIYTTMVASGIITFERMIALMSVTPRRLFGLGGESIEVGKTANLTIIDTSSAWTIDSSRFRSMGHSTPFDGWHVRGRCRATISNNTLLTVDRIDSIQTKI